MPCMDWNYSGRTSYEDTTRVDKLSRIACELARKLEAVGRDHVLSPNVSIETAKWWVAHKEADRQRELREAKQRRIAKIKREAVSKLTTEERRALGL